MSKKVWKHDAISVILLPSGSQGEKILDLALEWSRSWLLTPALWMMADEVKEFDPDLDISLQTPPDLFGYMLGRDLEQNPVKERVNIFWTLGSQAFTTIRFIAVRTEQDIELMNLTNIAAETASKFIERAVPGNLDLYRRYNLVPTADLAGIMMAGLIADTLLLKSPTTTPKDAAVLEWLETHAEIKGKALAKLIFSSGSVILASPPDKIVRSDFKIYEEDGIPFAVSQVEELGFDNFWLHAKAITKALRELRQDEKLSFAALLVTDINTQNSLMILQGEPEFTRRISYAHVEQDEIFDLPGVVSRKKQLIPYLSSLLKEMSVDGETAPLRKKSAAAARRFDAKIGRRRQCEEGRVFAATQNQGHLFLISAGTRNVRRCFGATYPDAIVADSRASALGRQGGCRSKQKRQCCPGPYCLGCHIASLRKSGWPKTTPSARSLARPETGKFKNP